MSDWELLRTKRVYDGYRKIDRREYRLPDGREAGFDVEDSGEGAVGVVALTPDNQVVCYQTYRPGPARQLIEVPGGAIDKGEAAVTAGARELLEETGYECETLELVYEYWRDAYKSATWKVCFGTGAKKVAEQDLEDEESGEVVLLGIPEFLANAREGNLTDAPAAFYCAELLRAEED